LLACMRPGARHTFEKAETTSQNKARIWQGTKKRWMAAHRPATEKGRPSSNPRNFGSVDDGAGTYEQRLRDRRPEPNQPPSELPEKPKAQESRSTLRRLLEAFIAVVMEESVRSFIPVLLPYA